MRTATVKRTSKETDISAELNLDGGAVSAETGIGFFDHMLTAFAVHGGFGLQLTCKGDLQVDCHHTVEDTGIVLGKAFAQALGDKSGIARYGSFFVPMDEALGFCAADISGRPFWCFRQSFPKSASVHLTPVWQKNFSALSVQRRASPCTCVRPTAKIPIIF